jgi:4-hydroxy-tetrahydrodipicolinate synthase
LKDSSGNLYHAITLARELEDRLIFTGNDKLLSQTLIAGASGCITALANLASPALRRIYDRHQKGEDINEIQNKVDQARDVLDDYTPFPASVKGLLAQLHNFPHWPVKPPLMPFQKQVMAKAAEEMKAFLEI